MTPVDVGRAATEIFDGTSGGIWCIQVEKTQYSCGFQEMIRLPLSNIGRLRVAYFFVSIRVIVASPQTLSFR
jgi:hypothetical protein